VGDGRRSFSSRVLGLRILDDNLGRQGDYLLGKSILDVRSKELYLVALLDSNGARLRIKSEKIFGWGMFDLGKNSGCRLTGGQI
jgi:hypothetical protein